MTDSPHFDAIVIGSGISGGWAAKELTERGLKVLMLERGRMVEHQSGYETETQAPWEMPFQGNGDPKWNAENQPVQSQLWLVNEWNKQYFVNDKEHPYQTAGGEFSWIRGYQLGGRSLTWGRQALRWSDDDFQANKRDGHGNDWPIRYADIAPWYSYVENFIGVSGTRENVPTLPDGEFLPPMELNAGEMHAKKAIEAAYPNRKLISGRTANLSQGLGDRAPCQYRGVCSRGCSYGAYFSTQSSTLPAARKTGLLTLMTDMMVEEIEYDPKTKRVTGVRTFNTKTKGRNRFTSDIVFSNAGSFNTVALLLRSKNESFPNGLANSSGILGHYILDHATTMAARATIPGVEDRTYYGNRPNVLLIPRWRNYGDDEADFMRGYSFQGSATRRGWKRGGGMAGIGNELKEAMQQPGGWSIALPTMIEGLPYKRNCLSLHATERDSMGFPQIVIDFAFGENEKMAAIDAQKEAQNMVATFGGQVLDTSAELNVAGLSVHEMGGARMGNDPSESVLNKYNQAHDIPNLFVTDGAFMCSTACQNPSLTYMAMTARAAENAVSMLKEGAI